MAEPTLYRSARGSTVELLGGSDANCVIHFHYRDETIDLQGWRSVRFRNNPPRLAVWCDGDPKPREIPLEEVVSCDA